MNDNVPETQQDGITSLLRHDPIRKRFEGMLGKKAPGFMSSIISATQANRELKKSDPLSIVAAAAVAAALDLPINPSLGFAYIVPYDGKAQFQVGYKGFIQLGMRTGQYKTINACEVYEGELRRSNRFTNDMEFDESGRTSDVIIGYVAYFRLTNGFEKWLYMTVEQVKAHGARYSRSFNNPKGKWQTDFEAMARKTVLKMLLSHYGILSIEMQTAIQADQAVVKEVGGKYTYPDGRGDDVDTIDMEDVDGGGSQEGDDGRNHDELMSAFDASIPVGSDPALVNAFLSAVAVGNKKTVNQIKIEASKTPTDLQKMWALFPAWCKQRAAGAEKKGNGAGKNDLAPGECPDRDAGTVMTASYCNTQCAHRQGCPTWEGK